FTCSIFEASSVAEPLGVEAGVAGCAAGAETAMPNGVRRKRPPGFASSIIHNAPSGATSTSRILWPTSQPPAVCAPPLPSKVMRMSAIDDRAPIDPGLGQVRARIRTGDGNSVVVESVGGERPAIILAGQDQVEFIAATWAMFEFPQPSIRRKGETIGRAEAGGPCLRGRQVGTGKGVRPDHRGRLCPL